MIPILYESTETAFTSNGLGRLRDCIEAKVVEERNGVYELDFSYPIDGAHFDEIKVGRIIGVTHDDTGDIQPFDIVSYERPIDGIVKFHCTHISYRQSFYTVTASNVSVIWPNAFSIFTNQSSPSGNPFNYTLDFPNGMTNSVIAAFDGLPHSIRSILGGEEGSILDSIVGGCEFEWNKWDVILHQNRGQYRDFTVRYGVNMLNYDESYSIESAYSSCIPYWTDGTQKVIGDRQTGSRATITGRGETIPVDVSDKFEGKPTKAQVNAAGLSYLNSNATALPVQTISVEFIRLQDTMSELSNLMTCRLCDSIRVIFPDYNSSGIFKIVKTEWDVLSDKYVKMELGELSTTLAEALGVSGSGSAMTGAVSPEDFVTETGSSGAWNYRKWNSGKVEAWATLSFASASWATWSSPVRYMDKSITIPSGIFLSTPNATATSKSNQYWIVDCNATSATAASMRLASLTSSAMATSVNVYAWTN